MKHGLVLTGCLLALPCAGQPWERVHTFTNATYGLLACSATQQVCLSDSFLVATSNDLTNWTEHGAASLPASLYETTEYGVSLGPLHLVVLPQGGYLMVVGKTEFPQLGNFRIRTLLSLKSRDGLVWSEQATIDAYTGPVHASFLGQTDRQIVFMYGDYPEGWLEGCVLSQCRFFAYDAQSNAWGGTHQISALPASFHLFSDAEAFYFVHRHCPDLVIGHDPDLTFIERSTDGRTWASMPSTTSYVWSADAHHGQIFGAEACYSSGTGWQPAPNTQLRHILYNGDTVVGTLDGDLVVSRDFGGSWQGQPLGEMDRLDVADIGDRYVALVTERFRDDDPATPDVLQRSLFVAESHTARALQTNMLALTMEGRSLAFAAQANVVYQVETTHRLSPPDWIPYGLPLVASAPRLSVPLDSGTKEHAFFRVVAASAQPDAGQSR